MQTVPSTTKTAFGYQNATYLVRRGGVWQYRRRLPASLAERLAKTEVRISTGARERTEALRAAAQISAALEAEWRKLLATPAASDATGQSLAKVLVTAQSLGVSYQPAAELAAGRLEEILARIERIVGPTQQVGGAEPAEPAPAVVSAVLGGAGRPQLKLSDLVEAYHKLAKDQAIGKSEKQMKRWKGSYGRILVMAAGDQAAALG